MIISIVQPIWALLSWKRSGVETSSAALWSTKNSITWYGCLNVSEAGECMTSGWAMLRNIYWRDHNVHYWIQKYSYKNHPIIWHDTQDQSVWNNYLKQTVIYCMVNSEIQNTVGYYLGLFKNNSQSLHVHLFH